MLLLTLSSLGSCEIAVEAGEAEGVASLARTGVPAEMLGEEAAVGRAALRGFVDEVALDSRTTIRVAGGGVYHGSVRIGTLRANGELALARATGGEAIVGRLFDNRIWIPEADGTVIPAAEFRAAATGEAPLRSAPSSGATVLTRLPRGASVRVLAVHDGWIEVEYGSYRGWAPTALISVWLVPIAQPEVRRLAADACVRPMDRADRSALPAPRETLRSDVRFDSARAAESARPGDVPANWKRLMAGERITVRYVARQAEPAGRVVGRLQQAGVNVGSERVDDDASIVCGGGVFYDIGDVDAAQAVRASIADIVRLDLDSHDFGGTIVIWIR